MRIGVLHGICEVVGGVPLRGRVALFAGPKPRLSPWISPRLSGALVDVVACQWGLLLGKFAGPTNGEFFGVGAAGAQVLFDGSHYLRMFGGDVAGFAQILIEVVEF